MSVGATFVLNRGHDRTRAQIRAAVAEYVRHLEDGDAEASGRMLGDDGCGEAGDLARRFNSVQSGFAEVDAATRKRFGVGLSGMTFPPADSLADAARGA